MTAYLDSNKQVDPTKFVITVENSYEKNALMQVSVVSLKSSKDLLSTDVVQLNQ
jgi:hypothetical protein